MDFEQSFQNEEPLPSEKLKCNNKTQKSQIFLIKCLLKQSHGTDISCWGLFNKWLTLQNEHEPGHHSSNITQKDIIFIVKQITQHFDSCYSIANEDTKSILVETLQCIVNNSIFQQYFHHHPEAYIDFLSTTLNQIQDSTNLLSLLKPTNNFFKHTALHNNFSSYFMKTLFVPLVKINEKFGHDSDIFKESASLLQKSLVNKNVGFTANSEDITLRNEFLVVFDAITSFFNRQELNFAKTAYKLFFQCVCNLYNKSYKAIYNFFVLLVNHLGFDVKESYSIKNPVVLPNVNLQFSLEILADAVNILANHNCDLDCTINQVTFSDFLKNILSLIMNLSVVPNLQVYSVMQSLILLNPVIIEQLAPEILAYLMINQQSSSELQQEYEKLIVSIFQVFSKLHRIEKLISIMVQSVRSKLIGEFKQGNVPYNFLGNNDLIEKNLVVLPDVEFMLSSTVLQAFSNSVISLLSWQVINIFKSLNYHFTDMLEMKNEDERFYCYVEILSGLFCCFLCGVRVAEHTVSTAMQEKFCKEMNDLKASLSKFGGALLNREHKHVLMRAYLNICYAWGDVCLILAYYSPDIESIAAKVEDSDYSLCNLVYLHNYLSREQWCIIAQRITNFGEVHCKYVMHKLYLQKLKAMYTFKAASYLEAKRSFIKDSTLEIENNWKVLLQEPLFLKDILPEMDEQTVLSAADFVFKSYITDGNNLLKSQHVLNNSVLMRSVLYWTMHKINKLFKHKQRNSETTKKILTKQLFSIVDVNLFVYGRDLKEVCDVFVENLQHNSAAAVIDSSKLDRYLNLIKELPILHMPTATREILLLFLIALLHDCKNGLQNEVEEHLVLIITGLIHHNPTMLPKIIPFNILFSKIISLFSNWENILETNLQWIVKNIDALRKLQDGIDYILKLDRNLFLKHASIVLNIMNEQAKKVKSCQESKDLLTLYRLQVCKRVVEVLDKKDLNRSLEAYALALKFYLSQNKPHSLREIENNLTPHLDYSVTSLSNGSLQLMLTVLQNNLVTKTEESLLVKIWQTIKREIVKESSSNKNLLQLYVYILEHVNDKEFELVSNELCEATKSSLESEEVEKYLYYLSIWNSALVCCFNPVKTSTWQNNLDRLLKEQREYLSQNSNIPMLIIEETGKFQRRLIQVIPVPLTVTMIDTVISTPSALLISTNQNFSSIFAISISIMESLLKYRNSPIMDRLPAYLQQYRYLLEQLCIRSNCDLNLKMDEIQILSDCAHMLEKLTNMLIQNRKHVTRVAAYVIADFLHLFEQYTLPSNIRVHLNNSFYSLLSLCDQHAVSFLMRVLSTASTEMFKIMFEHYKKHYRFTGKV